MKFLLVIAVIAVGYLWWRHHRSLEGNRQQGPEPPRRPSASDSAEPQRMVRCVVCGVHLPAVDAANSDQGAHCPEHLPRKSP